MHLEISLELSDEFFVFWSWSRCYQGTKLLALHRFPPEQGTRDHFFARFLACSIMANCLQLIISQYKMEFGDMKISRVLSSSSEPSLPELRQLLSWDSLLNHLWKMSLKMFQSYVCAYLCHIMYPLHLGCRWHWEQFHVQFLEREWACNSQLAFSSTKVFDAEPVYSVSRTTFHNRLFPNRSTKRESELSERFISEPRSRYDPKPNLRSA